MGWVKTEKTNKLSKLGDINFTTTAPVDGNTLVYDETNGVWIPGEGGGGNANEMVLTQDEYDALTPEEQLNGTNYYINDASVGAQSAAGTPYDNSSSDLLATDVQDAIDEVVMEITNKVDKVNGKGLSTEDYTTAEKTKVSGIPDFNITSPSDGQMLKYDGTAQKWVNYGIVLTDTLAAGDSEITFTNAAITTDSDLQFKTSIYGVNPIGVSVSQGSLTLVFDPQSSALGVKVVIA